MSEQKNYPLEIAVGVGLFIGALVWAIDLANTRQWDVIGALIGAAAGFAMGGLTYGVANFVEAYAQRRFDGEEDQFEEDVEVVQETAVSSPPQNPRRKMESSRPLADFFNTGRGLVRIPNTVARANLDAILGARASGELTAVSENQLHAISISRYQKATPNAKSVIQFLQDQKWIGRGDAPHEWTEAGLMAFPPPPQGNGRLGAGVSTATTTTTSHHQPPLAGEVHYAA